MKQKGLYRNIADWYIARDKLRGQFSMGIIVDSSKEQLEDYLIILANTQKHQWASRVDETGLAEYQRETEAFTYTVKHLLDAKTNTKRFKISIILSVAAIILSIVSAVVSLNNVFHWKK